MSVVIKGFNKPANCLSCPFNHSDCWCTITKGGIDRDDYSCNLPCPIEPLPKGHGRLKDVDTFVPDCQEQSVYYDDDEYNVYTAVGISQIECAPTIIEADKIESENKE